MVLVDIGGGFQLAAPAAAAWARAVAAGCPQTITSAYRDPVRQQQMRDAYLIALTAWMRTHAGPKPTLVAAVSKSEHVTGNALDLKDPAIAWMHAHPEFGFVFTDSTERWHVAYRADQDVHLVDLPVTTTPVVTPPPTVTTGPDPLTPLEDDDMALNIITNGNAWAVTDGLTKRIIAGGEDLQLLVDLGEITQAKIDLARDGKRAIAPALWDARPTVK